MELTKITHLTTQAQAEQAITDRLHQAIAKYLDKIATDPIYPNGLYITIDISEGGDTKQIALNVANYNDFIIRTSGNGATL